AKLAGQADTVLGGQAGCHDRSIVWQDHGSVIQNNEGSCRRETASFARAWASRPVSVSRGTGYNLTVVRFRPKWRNGRRARLKIWYPKGCVGSSPTFGSQDQE